MVPNKTLHRCRREPSAIGPQQNLQLLQERTLLLWFPARPYTAAGENPLPLVPSTTLNCCKREPFCNGSQQGLTSLQGRTPCHWSPARPYIAARENPLPLVPSTALNCRRRKPFAIGTQQNLKLIQQGAIFNGSQQDLAPLQERTLCHRLPARLQIAAGEKFCAMVHSKSLYRCMR